MDMSGKFLDRFRQKGPSRPRSKAEAEKRRRLAIVLLIVVAIVVSVGIVGYGYYNTDVKPWRQPILKVNSTTYDMRYFVNLMRLYGLTTSDYVDSLISAMEENALTRQYLKSEFPDVDLGAVTSDEAVRAKTREILGLSDNTTQEEFDEAYSNWLENFKQNGSSEKDLIEIGIKPMLVNEELQKQIGDRDYPTTDNYQHAQVQALLINGSDNATMMRTRWEAGEDFDTLRLEKSVSESVRESSDNKETNWVARGIKSEVFDNCTFTATPGVLNQAIKDSGDTYWIIKVIARESKPLSETDRETLINQAFSKWLGEFKSSDENEIINYLNEEGGSAKLAWALDHVAVDTG